MSLTQENSYKQIVKSTGVFGGSQLLNMLIGVFRTKAAAALLGPVGVALLGLYQSIVDMIQSVSNLGLHFSAVKDISQAEASGNREELAKTAVVLRRWIRFAALLGCLLCIAFAKPISTYVFGSSDNTWAVCLLSFSVFMLTLSGGQKVLLQGMRRISSMAKASVLGTFFGFVASLFCYWFWGQDGIVPALLCSALLTWLMSWYYARRLVFGKIRLSLRETWQKGQSMLRLGICTVVVAVVSTLTLLAVKSLIRGWSDMETLGLFQSSWSLASIYLSAVLSAMAADYYPRLCGVSENHVLMNRYVNEQMHVVLVVATPLVSAMLLFSPEILHLFYSQKFVPAGPLLRWLVLGSFLKVMNWPLGYILLAKGKSFYFMLVEVFWYALFLALGCFIWPLMGLEAIGVAYLLAHLLYTLLLLLLTHRLSGFGLQKNKLSLSALYTLGVLCSFALAFLPGGWMKWLPSVLIFLLIIGLSYLELNRIWPLKEFMQSLIQRFCSARSSKK